MRFGTCAVVAIALVCGMGSVLTAAEPKGLEAGFDAGGRLTIHLDGSRVMDGPAAGPAPQALFREAGETVGLFGYQGKPARVDGAVIGTSFDPATRTAIQRMAWGSVTRQYNIAADRLECRITLKNDSSLVLYQFSSPVFSLSLPETTRAADVSEATYFGQTIGATVAENISGPLVLPLVAGDRAVVACSAEVDKALRLRWSGPPSAAPKPAVPHHDDPTARALARQEASRLGADAVAATAPWTLSIQAGGDQLVWHGRYASRPIAPGGSDTYVISLRIGDATDPVAPAADVCAAYAKARPMRLRWDDRRPILRSFIGDWFPHHPPVDLAGSKPAGVQVPEAFRKRVLDAADSLIENMKLADAQGMVIWNVEGSTVHAIKYVGDPRSVETMCPEMDQVADEFFGRIHAAGFRTGVCIRPTTLTPTRGKDGTLSFQHTHPAGDDPVDALCRKIAYARGRWGCTLFYIDTNENVRMPQTDEEKAWWPRLPDGSFKPYEQLMSAEQWEEILRRNPGVLLIPEHSYLACYTSSGPYDQMNMGRGAPGGVTPALVRATWPAAFKCLTGDWPLEKYFRSTAQVFAQGDVLMINTPLEDGGRPLAAAKAMAAFRTQGSPEDLATAAADALLAVASDDDADPRRRFFAAEALAGPSASADTLGKLLESDDWLVRKLALDAVVGEAHLPLIDRLLTEAADGRSSLRFSAAAAVSRLGPAALPALRQTARGTGPTATAATRLLGEMDPPAKPQ